MMFERLQNWLKPPAFAVMERDRIMQLQKYILVGFIAAGILLTGLSLLRGFHIETIFLYFVVIFTSALLYVVSRRGHVTLTSILLTSVLWNISFIASYMSGGLQSPAFSGFLIVIIAAGLLLGVQAALFSAFGATLAGAVLVFAEVSEILPPPYEAYTPLTFFTGYFSQILITTILIVLTVKYINKSITRSRKAEEKIRESEKRFRALVQNSTDLITVIDRQGWVLYVSPSIQDVLGYTVEEFKSQDSFTHMHPEEKPYFRKLLETGWPAEKDPIEAEYRYRHKDGSWRYLNAKGSDQRDNPAIGGFVVNARDITDRVKTEQALRESERDFREIFGNMQEGLYRTTPDGKILLVNPGLAKMLEYDSPRGLEGRAISTLPHWRKYDRDQFLEEISKTGKVKNFQSVWVTKSGKELQVRENARVVLNDDGSICHYEGTVEDITHQRQLEQQLIESQKMESLGHIAGGIAHDFNNVMTSISGALGVLSTKIDDPGLKRYVSMGLAGIERGQTVTNRMLTFTRAKDPEVRPVPIEQFFQDIREIISHTLPKNIRVDTNIEDDEMHVLADYAQLEQVFINLCINAADAMPDGGNIHLYAAQLSDDELDKMPDRKNTEYILFRVRDTGNGMAADVAERIFEPFYTTKERGQGTGLGLSVVYKIIQNHHGWIEVESVLNTGTTFNIGLPAAGPDKASQSEVPSIQDIRGHGEHILVVDDEPQIRYLLSDQLEALGYHVTTSEDGVSALQIFKAQPEQYSLIITDFGLPGMNGQDLAKEIHLIDQAKKIIGITGYIIDDDHALLNNGFLAIVKKPFELEALMKIISQSINEQD